MSDKRKLSTFGKRAPPSNGKGRIWRRRREELSVEEEIDAIPLREMNERVRRYEPHGVGEWRPPRGTVIIVGASPELMAVLRRKLNDGAEQ